MSYAASPTARTLIASWQLRARAELELRQRTGKRHAWPANFVNSDTGKAYEPHNDEEEIFVYDDLPRYGLVKGGEGSGKTTCGVVKTLHRLRRGQNGIMVSPDLEHFKKSLWPEFRRWCPWERVIERHRYRQQPGWEPTRPFTLVFHNETGGYSELMCGGCKETEIEAWEGPNVSFVHFDEARRHRTARAIKVFDGRARIPGPNGEPPQIFLTTTPRKHWLYEYFGPPKEDDPFAAFKADSYVATVLTQENIANLEAGFVEKRAQSLTEAEARILLRAEWEDEDDVEKFVKLVWWDACKEELPPLGRSEPLILALDAAKGGETTVADCFAMVGVTRHPSRPEDVAVRYCGIWQPPPNGLLDFAPIEAEVRRLCREFAVVEVAFDSYQLHDFTMRLGKEGIANFKEFSQTAARLKGDKQLQDLIMARRIAHDGNPLLTKHIDNANVKKSGSDGVRIVKRSNSLKVDAAVALAMAANRCLYYNLA